MKQSFIAPATIPLVASAADADGKISKVEFFNGKTLLTTEKLLPYTYNWTNVAAGTYTITAVATDDKGLKTTSAPITVTVTEQGALIVSNKPVSGNSKTGANNPISLKLYPNPASNVINILTAGLEAGKPSTISIISSLGVVVKTIQSNT